MKYFIMTLMIPVFLWFFLFAGTFNPGDSEGTLATGNMNTAGRHCVDVSTLQYIGLQFQHTATTAGDGSLVIDASVRANASATEDYDTYPSSTQSISVSTAGSYWWDIDVRSLGNICVVYSKGSNSSGTYTIYFRKEVPTK